MSISKLSGITPDPYPTNCETGEGPVDSTKKISSFGPSIISKTQSESYTPKKFLFQKSDSSQKLELIVKDLYKTTVTYPSNGTQITEHQAVIQKITKLDEVTQEKLIDIINNIITLAHSDIGKKLIEDKISNLLCTLTTQELDAVEELINDYRNKELNHSGEIIENPKVTTFKILDIIEEAKANAASNTEKERNIKAITIVNNLTEKIIKYFNEIDEDPKNISALNHNLIETANYIKIQINNLKKLYKVEELKDYIETLTELINDKIDEFHHSGNLSTKNAFLSDCFFAELFKNTNPEIILRKIQNSQITTELDKFIGDFDLRNLNSNLKFDPSDELNNCSKFSQNFRAFKWRAEGKYPEINVALAARHGPTDNIFLNGKTPSQISRNLSTAGFRSMISLSDYDNHEINLLWSSHGADHTRLCHPIADYSAPNPYTIKEIYDYALESAKKGKNLIINCGEGFGRSGVIMAGMLIYSYYNELKSTPDLLKEILTKECNKTEIKTLSAIEETTTTVKFAINSIRAGDNDRGTSVETKDQIRCLENLETIIRENLKAELKI